MAGNAGRRYAIRVTWKVPAVLDTAARLIHAMMKRDSAFPKTNAILTPVRSADAWEIHTEMIA